MLLWTALASVPLGFTQVNLVTGYLLSLNSEVIMFTPIAYTLDDDSKLLVLIHHIFLQCFFMVTLLEIERAGGAGAGCGETTLRTALTYPGYVVDGLWY